MPPATTSTAVAPSVTAQTDTSGALERKSLIKMTTRLTQIYVPFALWVLIRPAAWADGSSEGGSAALDTSHLKSRTLAAVRAQRRLVIDIMKDEKTGKREPLFLDARAITFTSYDDRLIAGIQDRWHSLCKDLRSFQRFGRVVIEFRVSSEGDITEMKVLENEAGPILALFCQQALLEASPFPDFPSDMRRMHGNSRTMRMNFYYD